MDKQLHRREDDREEVNKGEEGGAAAREEAPARPATGPGGPLVYKILSGVALLLAGALGGGAAMRALAGAPGAGGASGALFAAGAAEVQTMTVEARRMERPLYTTGVLTAGERAVVYAPVSAPIQQVHVQPGDLVAEGQKLFSFGTVELERSHRQAQAALALLELRYKAGQLKAADEELAVYLNEQDRKSVQESMAATREQLEFAGTQCTEFKDAYAKYLETALPELELDRKELKELEQQLAQIGNPEDPRYMALQFEIAEKEYYIALCEDQMAFMQGQIRESEKQVADLEKMLAALEKALATLEKQQGGSHSNPELDENSEQQHIVQKVTLQVGLETAQDNLQAGLQGVSAPIAGRITGILPAPGGKVTQYAQLCIIESVDKAGCVVALSPQEAEQVREGQRALVRTMGREYEATVARVYSTLPDENDETGGEMRALLMLAQPDAGIRYGLRVEVAITTGVQDDWVLVPGAAVWQDGQGAHCFVVQDGCAVRRSVVLSGGADADGLVAVAEGLYPGDVLITGPLEGLGEGAPVLAQP